MRKISNQSGFTLIETLVAVGLLALLLVLISSVQNLVSKQTAKSTSRLSNTVDTLIGERTLFLDFRGLSPSFNTLQLRDDRGNFFFDYYSDVPDSLLASTRKDRIFTLEPGRNTFYFLSQDPVSGPLLNFDPVSAYEVGPIPADYNVPATLTYKSVNNNNWIASQRPQFWTQDHLLFFDTNVYERTRIPLDLMEAPTSPAFLGSVDVSSNQLASMNLAAYLKLSYENVDAFLRNLPSRGGGQPFVKVRHVHLYRYYLQPYTDLRVDGSPSRLFRDEFINGKFDKQHLISDKVKAVKFSRGTITNKVVQFSIEKLQDKIAK